MLKIIFADDEFLSVANFLKTILDDAEVNCMHFCDKPENAPIYAENHEVDAAFLDMYMPKLNGIELAKRLIAVKPNIKIVFVSAYDVDGEEVRQQLGDNFLGTVTKPYEGSDIYNYIIKIRTTLQRKREIRVRCFGAFQLFINGIAIDFPAKKAKELFALLIHKKGAIVTMDDALAFLWPNKDREHAVRLYRDTIYRLRMTLRDNDIEEMVSIMRARLCVSTSAIECDYWNLSEGNIVPSADVYMPEYDWASEEQAFLEKKYKKY